MSENPCWKGYEMIGTKKKNGKDVPNCVPVSEENEIDELNTTASAGGEYATPHAFAGKTKKKKHYKPKEWSYVDMDETKLRKLRKIIEHIVRNEFELNEITYNEFKKDESQTFKQKVNNGIHEVAKQIRQIEQTVSRLSKLKTEAGADQTIFLKESSRKLNQISERLLRLQNMIREINK
jgi:hypothetical protein